MASEPSEEGVSVSLPPDLEEWLDRRAADLGLDRETVVVQLLASYRATEELEDRDPSVVATEDMAREVREVVADRIDDIAAAVAQQLEDPGEIEARLADDVDRVETELDRLEADVDEKIRDVRERVIQVKRETDAKAPADHTHDRIDEVADAVADLEAEVESLDRTVEDHTDELADLRDSLADVEESVDRLDSLEERLRTVAWVVSDLRDAHEARSAGTDAIDRLKRSAAELDVSRAVCENCSEPVEIALLSEPTCPHCDATVSDVEAGGRIFGNPKLRVARQLEAGDEDDHANVPDAADPGENE